MNDAGFAVDIYEFVKICGVEIHIYHAPGAWSKWIANLKAPYHEVFFKDSDDDCMSAYTSGWGESPQVAIVDLINNLKAKKYMVVQPGVHAKTAPRRKYVLPEKLSLYD